MKWISDLVNWIQSWSYEAWLIVTFGLAAAAVYFLKVALKKNDAYKIKSFKPVPFILFAIAGALSVFVGLAR